jgi:hypothetical protein
MSIVLRPFNLPDFGEPGSQPKLPPATYQARCDEAYRRAACDWITV